MWSGLWCSLVLQVIKVLLTAVASPTFQGKGPPAVVQLRCSRQLSVDAFADGNEEIVRTKVDQQLTWLYLL